MKETEFAVIGGGLVGMAVAYGLQGRGRQVTVFDEGDMAYRASRGNFGLVWVQGKGAEMPPYAGWTRRSARLWPKLAAELREHTGIDLELIQQGGLDISLDEDELDARARRYANLRDALDGDYPFEVLTPERLKDMLPAIGPEVAGATYFPEDGHVNPLLLLRALVAGFQARGGRLENGTSIRGVEPDGDGFRILSATDWRAGRVVLAAGLGNATLGPRLGLKAPVKPVRGQVLICERVRPFLDLPTVQVRQVPNGTVQIGDSKEDVGFDDGTDPRVIARIAHRATRMFPILDSVRVVRSWGALRVMSPDGHPIYEQSEQHPGAFVVTCHSGVTLAAGHAYVLTGWIEGGDPDSLNLEPFSAKRFEIPSAA